LAVVTSATRRRPRLSPFRSSMAASKRPQTSSSARAVLQHLRTGRRQDDLAPGLLEERQTQGIDDLPDLQRNRGLGQMQRLGSFREAALVGDRGEGFELAER
jgi:hypothetical protein